MEGQLNQSSFGGKNERSEYIPWGGEVPSLDSMILSIRGKDIVNEAL